MFCPDSDLRSNDFCRVSSVFFLNLFDLCKTLLLHVAFTLQQCPIHGIFVGPSVLPFTGSVPVSVVRRPGTPKGMRVEVLNLQKNKNIHNGYYVYIYIRMYIYILLYYIIILFIFIYIYTFTYIHLHIFSYYIYISIFPYSIFCCCFLFGGFLDNFESFGDTSVIESWSHRSMRITGRIVVPK